MTKPGNILLADDDIMVLQILPRLPARSLGRCKCVCKHWHSFLTTPVFTKMHLHHVNNHDHHKQLLVPSRRPYKYFRTMDCETPELGLSANGCIPFETNTNNMVILSSLNGLLCVGIYSLVSYSYSDIILWNPLTGDYKTLSKDNCHADGFPISRRGYGLYYSSCDDDYKLLRVTESSNAYIYSLKSDSWRKVESTSCRFLKRCNLSCLLNENLYILSHGKKEINVRSYSIIRFDTNTEKFTEIAAPSLPYLVTCCFSLTIVSGCVHLCASSNGVNSWDKLDLWKMEGDGEWTKVTSLCLAFTHEFCQPLHPMKNGIWLVDSRNEGYVEEVDLVRKTTKRVCTYISDGCMHILWGGKFVETIVSLSR